VRAGTLEEEYRRELRYLEESDELYTEMTECGTKRRVISVNNERSLDENRHQN
jgi:hypothetical protein